MIDFKPPPLFAKAGGFTAMSTAGSTRPGGRQHRLHGRRRRQNRRRYAGGRPGLGISIWSNHLVTPETETTCHYHFGFARNFQRDDQAMSKLLHEGTIKTFLEDKVMLEAQQKNL